MSFYTDKATVSHSSARKPGWLVEYRDAEGGSPTQIEVSAVDQERAIRKASQLLEIWKPAHALHFQSVEMQAA